MSVRKDQIETGSHIHDSQRANQNRENIVRKTKNALEETPQIFLTNNNNRLPNQMGNYDIFPKKNSASVKFEDVTFSSYTWNWSLKLLKNGRLKKEILHGVCGEFKAGQLSAIMGPSGAGKTTLLNVLAGFITRGSTGTIKLNGKIQNSSSKYKALSAYIPQEDEIRLELTVKEAMSFAAHLKLGYVISDKEKMEKICQILERLGLYESLNTLTSRLSGGQRKRLAVALELINNPPILFLDEPTSGLDSSSCSQCVSLFKKIAEEGRTVIATIHQPSALIFEMFDKVYALSSGNCIYDGKPKDLLKHLAEMNLRCPPYHNPADYLIEVAVGEHGADVEVMSERVKAIQLDENSDNDIVNNNEEEIILQPSDTPDFVPAAVIMQFLLLFKRNLIITKRSYSWVLNRWLAHIIVGLLFGYLYQDVGIGANTVLANYVYLYGSLLLLVYTGKMPVTLCFPLEMRILLREHFNRWYKLSPYLLSMILLEIPFQIFCIFSYVSISYWLTNQPFDFRFSVFISFTIACSLCAQSMGYLIGATTNIKVAVFLGPVTACLLSVFGFCIRYLDTPVMFRWIYNLSYFRAGFQSIVYTIYGFNRTKLFCPEEEEYCHYQDPRFFLDEMEMVDVGLVSNISLIIFFWCLMNAATFLVLWFKLNKR